MATGDFRVPGVYIQEVQGLPTATPNSSSVAGLVGIAKKGPVNRAVLVSNFTDFGKKFGSYYQDNYLAYALKGFYDGGGSIAYISRVVGAGAATAELDLLAFEGGPATSGSVLSANSEPFAMAASGLTVVVSVDGAPTAFASINGTAAAVTAAGGVFLSAFTGGETLEVAIDGGATQEITFAAADDSSAANIAAVINGQLVGGYADVSGGQVRITSDVKGTDSEVEIVGGTGAATLGFTATSVSGTGNVANLAAVTAAEAAAAIDLAVAGLTATAEAGQIRLTSDTSGLTSSVQVTVASTATEFGFDNLVHSGVASTSTDAITVKAHNPGSWGNELEVSTARWSLTTASVLNTGGSSVTLSSVRNVQVGDMALIGDPAGVFAIVHIRAINTTTKVISFLPVTLSGSIPSGSAIKSSSMHRAVTTSTQASLVGDTFIKVANTNGFRRGSIVVIDDGVVTPLKSYVVDSVSGTSLHFASALGSAFASGAVVSSQEFMLQVREAGVENPPYEYLSVEPDNKQDYFGLRFAADNATFLIEMEDLAPSTSGEVFRLPMPISYSALLGGADGAALVDNDYIGSATAPKSGIYLLEDKVDLNIMAIPGATSPSILQAAVALAETLQTVMVVGTGPVNMTDADEILNYRNFTLGIDSTQFAFYMPWLKERDPFNRENILNIPPEGKMMGLWAASSDNRGIQVVPANIVVPNILGLSHEFSDADQFILDPRGINLIRNRGTRGIRVWGAQTLTSETDGRQFIHTRRVLNLVERTVKQICEEFVFAGIESSTFQSVEAVIGRFLGGLWSQGVFGSVDVSRAFFVKCDEENNDEATRAAGQIIVDVGIRPIGVGKFVIARIGTWDGGTTIQEEIARRG